MKKRILVIAAHPDDEILGCGGTMARSVREGVEVRVLIMAEGLTSRDDVRNRDNREKDLHELSRSARAAADIIGISDLQFLDFPDNRMDEVSLLDIIKPVEKLLGEFRPEIVFTHSAGDVNIDHRRINEAVVTATRPVPGQCVRELYFFEVASSTEWNFGGAESGFQPDAYFELSEEDLGKKLKALEAYSMEMRDFPHARSLRALEALARWRGANAGMAAAEAFQTGRILR